MSDGIDSVTLSTADGSVSMSYADFIERTERMANKTGTLPLFETKQPEGQTLKVSGTAELDAALHAAHHLDDIVWVVAACRTTKVGHEFNKDEQLVRVETLAPSKLVCIPSVEGEKLMDQVFADAGLTLPLG